MTHFRFFHQAATILLVGLFSTSAFAQDGNPSLINENNVGWEFGAHIGNILPNQIDGATEIFPQWGARAGWNIGGGSFAEVGATAGRGEGVDWTSLSTSIRAGMPVENLLAIAYIGLDLNYYSGVEEPKEMFIGGHLGGGFMVPISPSTWFRADMKFNVSPGTSLHIMGGFMFRFAGGGGGGSTSN